MSLSICVVNVSEKVKHKWKCSFWSVMQYLSCLWWREFSFFFKSKSSKSVFPSVTFIGVALFTFNQGTTEKFYKITSANTLALICDATVVFKNDSRYTLSEPHFSICLQRLGVTVYFLFCWFACDVFFLLQYDYRADPSTVWMCRC